MNKEEAIERVVMLFILRGGRSVRFRFSIGNRRGFNAIGDFTQWLPRRFRSAFIVLPHFRSLSSSLCVAQFKERNASVFWPNVLFLHLNFLQGGRTKNNTTTYYCFLVSSFNLSRVRKRLVAIFYFLQLT